MLQDLFSRRVLFIIFRAWSFKLFIISVQKVLISLGIWRGIVISFDNVIIFCNLAPCNTVFSIRRVVYLMVGNAVI